MEHPTDIATFEIQPGLWGWRQLHPDWTPDADYEPMVSSWCVTSGGVTITIDALAPPHGSPADARLLAAHPDVALVLKPDHVRDVDALVARFGCAAYGPWLFYRGGVPSTELTPVQSGDALPGGLIALHDGRGRAETPVWLPEQRTIVVADALTAPEGELRIWATPWHEERVVPALRAWLDLPFETVVVSHGAPVHDRAAFERALTLPPWGEVE